MPDWFPDYGPSTPDDDPVPPDFEAGPSAEPIADTPLDAAAQAATLPAPAVADLTLGGAGVARRADGVPVEVAAESGAGRGVGVRVEVLDQALSQRAGVRGFAFKLTGVGGTLAAAGSELPATLNVDYSAFKDLYGGGYADRLQVVTLPECALADPVPEGCDRHGTVLSSTNDRSSSILTVDVADLAKVQGTPLVAAPAPDVAADTAESSSAPESTTTTTTEGSETVEDAEAASTTSTTAAPAPEAATDEVAGPEAAAPAAAPAVVLAVTSGPEGPEGSFKATPFSASGDWQVGVGSGEFSWSYSVPMPPSPAGATPSLSMSYSSAAVDGMVTSKNTQAGQGGLGWSDFNSSFIERRYNACSDDGPNAWQTPDLCWANDNASISLNGQSSELVPVQGQTGEPTKWRLKSDPRWQVERLHITDPALSNGDNDKEYWKVTTPDGTQYWFGLGQWGTGWWSTNSTWTAPVFGDDAGEPCSGATPAASWCYQAWRWNLDHVVDPNGNMQIFLYGKEDNSYMRFDGVGQPRVLTPYVRSGYATEIHYGVTQSTIGFLAAAVIDSNWRCATLDAPGTPPCEPAPIGGEFDPAQWPDTPTDLFCVNDTCQQFAPTFWSARRYTGVRTYLTTPSGEPLNQDSIKFTAGWQDTDPNAPGTQDPKLWLTGIQRTGLASDTGAQTVLPAISFGQVQLSNRHNPGTESAMPHWRVGQVTDEFGGQINVTYGQPHPCNPPPMQGDPSQSAWDLNTTDCFPQKWAPDGSPDPATFRAFNKYLVTQVEVKDTTGGSPSMITKYLYGDQINGAGGAPQTWNATRDQAGAAWHHDNADPWVPQSEQSWSDWRGYQDVLVVQGSSRTRYKVHRGMDGDLVGEPPDFRDVKLTSLDGTATAVEDDNWLSGRILDELSIRPDGSPEVGTVHRYATAITADAAGSDPLADAHWVAENDTVERRRTPASGTVFARKRTQTNYNGILFFPEQVIEHGWTDQTGDERCTVTQYTFDTAKWMLDFPARVWRTPNSTCSGNAATRSDIAYDGLPVLQAPLKGNPTTTRVQITGTSATSGTWAATSMTYDQWGRPRTVTDPNNHTATTDYDGDPAYEPTELGYSHTTTVTNAAGHVTRTNFVYDLGTPSEKGGITLGRQLPAETIDANGKKTTYRYDPLGRVTSARQPTEATGAASWLFEYDIDPNKSQVPVIRTQQLQDLNGAGGSARYLNTWVVYDSLLRERQTHTLSPTSGKTIVSDTTYNNMGLVAVASQPQAVTGTSGVGLLPRPAEDWANRTQTTYDHLGRAGWVVDWYDDADGDANPDDQYRQLIPTYTHNSVDSQWSIPNSSTTVGTRTLTVTDAFDRTSRVEEHDGTAWRPTIYDYDVADRLKTVTDPASNKITYSYDMAGRRTKMVDPDAGEWDYTYDLAGNQLTVQDAADAITATKYDVLNRPFERRKDSANGPLLASWVYDKPAQGGQPSEFGLLDFSTRHAANGDWKVDVAGYDTRNRPTGRTWTVPAGVTGLGGTYTVGYGYDRADHPTTVTYPAVGGLAAETVTTTYNSIGVPEKLAGLQEYVFGVHYDDRARADWFAMGQSTGATQNRFLGYDSNQRLSKQTTTTPAGTIQDRDIKYDQVGNVTERNTSLNGGAFRECFGYDKRDRLTSAYTTSPSNTCASGTGKGTGANPYNHQYTYTVDGNLNTRVEGGVTTTYTYPAGGAGSVRPHAPTAVGSDSYMWNANGNLDARTVSGQTEDLIWDAEHRLSAIDDPDGDSAFTYDPDGQRLLRETPQGKTLYIDGHEITAPSGGGAPTAVRSYGMGYQPIATRSAAGIDYLSVDNQSSVELSVRQGGTGTPNTVRTYLPYGKVRTGAQLKTDRAWISQVEDDQTGLQYLNARYYDPSLGLFTGTDPVADPARPKTFNSYQYSGSNPTSSSDPSGLDFQRCGTCPTEIGGNLRAHQAETDLRARQERARQKHIIAGYEDPSADASTVFDWENDRCLENCGVIDQLVKERLEDCDNPDFPPSPNEFVQRCNSISIEREIIREIEDRSELTLDERLIDGLDSLDALAELGFGSYRAFKRRFGSAGQGMEWHHIVEQTDGNVARFGPQLVQNTSNIMRLDASVHRQISAYYSSKQPFTGGQTVREWLSTQSFQEQLEFGLRTLKNLGVLP